MLRLPLSSKGIRLKIMPGGRTPSRQRRCLNFEAGAWAHDGEVRRRVLMELIARMGVFFIGGTKHVDDRAPPPDRRCRRRRAARGCRWQPPSLPRRAFPHR